VSGQLDCAALLTGAIIVLPCEALNAGFTYVALLPVRARVNAQAAIIEAPVNDKQDFPVTCYMSSPSLCDGEHPHLSSIFSKEVKHVV
jgi:hypothetical protein